MIIIFHQNGTISHCMNIPHFASICSSGGRHLGCFHFLAIMNNGAMASMYKFLCEYLSSMISVKCRIRIAELYGYSVFNFLGNFHTVFHSSLHHFVIPPVMYKSFSFSTSSPTLIVCYFDYRYPTRCEVVSHFGFDLHFPNDAKHLFMFLVAICVSVNKCLLKSFAHFFKNWVVCLFVVELEEWILEPLSVL